MANHEASGTNRTVIVMSPKVGQGLFSAFSTQSGYRTSHVYTLLKRDLMVFIWNHAEVRSSHVNHRLHSTSVGDKNCQPLNVPQTTDEIFTTLTDDIFSPGFLDICGYKHQYPNGFVLVSMLPRMLHPSNIVRRQCHLNMNYSMQYFFQKQRTG